MTQTTPATDWRSLYLAVMAIQLALVEYLAQPDATVAGVARILAGPELEDEGQR